jgi:hypothetical protein
MQQVVGGGQQVGAPSLDGGLAGVDALPSVIADKDTVVGQYLQCQFEFVLAVGQSTSTSKPWT